MHGLLLYFLAALAAAAALGAIAIGAVVVAALFVVAVGALLMIVFAAGAAVLMLSIILVGALGSDHEPTYADYTAVIVLFGVVHAVATVVIAALAARGGTAKHGSS